jgi:transposase
LTQAATTSYERLTDLARQHVELVAGYLSAHPMQWHKVDAIRRTLQRQILTPMNRRYVTNAAKVLRGVFGWSIEATSKGLRLVSEPAPLVWPDDLDAVVAQAIDLTPDKRRIVEQLEAAAVEHDGASFIRASVAARIIGISPGVQTRWIADGHIEPVRLTVPRGGHAPRGILTAWPLAQTIQRAIAYRPLIVQAWSDDDLDYLLDHAGVDSVQDIAEHLGRSIYSVGDKMASLGINQRTAQGLMTTGQVAKLCGVHIEAIQTWCLRRDPALRFIRSPAGDRVKLIDPADLKTFFEQTPQLLDNKPPAVQRRVRRFLKPAAQRRKEAMS